MGKADSITKQYMQNTAVFADAFNWLIYNGEPVIKPEQLHELDTTALAELYGANGESVQVQVYRDLLKCVTAMEDGKTAYLVLGVENQSAIHYAMPVRNWLYDAMQYYQQIQDTAAKHRKGSEKLTREEFLSGFSKKDKLIPVVTLVMYFGTQPWDGPRSLHQMFADADERVLACAADYRINLLEPSAMPDSDIDKLKTDLKNVCYYIKYAKDKEKLLSLLQTDTGFHSMKRLTAELLNLVTRSELTIPEAEEEINMCKAIEDIRTEAMTIGESRGIAIGESRGIAIGESRGIAIGESRGIAIGESRGIEKATITLLGNLIHDGILTLSQAAQRAKLTETQLQEKLAAAGLLLS